MQKIELFPHNEDGYRDLVNSLENNNLSFLERATGTGKSYILIKYIQEHFAQKRVLFVTLHDSMFKQLTQRDMPALGTSKEIYEKLDCILYSSIRQHSAEWYYENYDCIIFDEAHHCGAPLWGETIGELRDLIRTSDNKKMIGATATGTRYLDNYMDVAKEFFDNNISSRLSIANAILQEILPAPFYINNNHILLERFAKIQKKLRKLQNYQELDNIRENVISLREDLKTKINTNTLFKKYGVKRGEKYIIFCQNIEDLKSKKEVASSWFKDIAPIEKYEAHSDLDNTENQRQITEFENNNNPDTIKVMFAVNMFNEGLHIKGLDGIIMSRKIISPITYLQQIGRVLSYSARKKQIKIFDLVGNATEIDIIHNLYKELISEVKSKIDQNSDNLEHYKEIVERFKIVDECNEMLERLDTIEKFLDENYFNKEKIKRCISILKNYLANVDQNFMELLHDKKIDKEHLQIYYELRRLADSLSFEDYLELSRLGIIVSNYQDNTEVLEKIKIHGCFKNTQENEIKEIINKYNLFYINNNRRPTENDDINLVSKYRYYLSSMSKRNATKYLRNVEYPLNIEELLILKDFPTQEQFEEYTRYIENKYIEGITLDALEKRTIEYLSKFALFKENPIIQKLLNSNVQKIDDSIKVLKEYQQLFPNEKFEDRDKFKDSPDVQVAIDILHKNAIYITNLQFEVLLNMGIALPKEIDMTLEQRKQELGEYESFYEKEESIKKTIVDQINAFIEEHGRRPNTNNPEERDLTENYNTILKDSNNTWLKLITKTLIKSNIPLTIDEKVICDVDINDEDLALIYKSIKNEFTNCDIKTYNYNLIQKKLTILKRQNYIEDKLYEILKRTNNLIDYIFTKNKTEEKEKVKTFLFNNQAIIPFSLIPYVSTQLDMQLPYLSSESRESFINISHQMHCEEMQKINEYFNYLQEHGQRPAKSSELDVTIRKYLARSSEKDIRIHCNKLNELNIPLSTEECCLLRVSNLEVEKKLYEEILKKRENKTMDELDSRLYTRLNIQFTYGYKIEEEYQESSISITNRKIKNSIIDEIKEKIKNNPNEEIDFSNIYISESAKEELKKYRIIYLSKSFITNLIERMTKEQKSYKELLNESNLHLLKLMIKYCTSSNKNIELIDKLIKLNREIVLATNDINIEQFILSYLDFMKKNDKEPRLDSTDSEEKLLAKKYEILNELLTPEEKKTLFNSIRKDVQQLQKKDFYQEFINFIETNQRFPSIIGDTAEEIELAKEYQKIGTKLTIEQKKHIDTLLKKYQLNTIMFVEKKKGK